MKKQDFSSLTHFPGRDGNPFDKVLRFSEKIEKIPSILFLFILILFSLIPNLWRLAYTPLLFFFFLSDWFLISRLPRRNISFGPVKPQVFCLAILRMVFAFIPSPVNWLLQIIGTGLVIYGFWIEPQNIKVTHLNYKTGKLHKGNRFKMLHLGDLHLERKGYREEELLKKIKEINPDLILFSGDFLNLSYIRDEIAIQQANKVIQAWQAPYGVFCVTGSPAVDQPESVQSILSSTKAKLLKNELAKLKINEDEIEIIGLYCSHKPHIDTKELDKLNHRSSENLKILLYHSPDLAPDAAEAGMDIMLSGHTHGGQVRIPFIGALMTGSLYGKRFETGLYKLKNMSLYVSRGIGLEGAGAPRVRFLCSPEIAVWDIEGEG